MALKTVFEASQKEQENEKKKQVETKDAWIDIPQNQCLKNSINPNNQTSERALVIALKAHRFTESMTMHGVRNIFAKDISKHRR